MTTVRLAFMRRRGDAVGLGCVLALVTVIALGETGAVGTGGCLLVAAAIVAAAALGGPRSCWLQADDTGLTLVRLLVRRGYGWPEIRGLAMEFDEEAETGAHRLTLRLRLAEPRGRHWGPFLGRLPVTGDARPRGTEPRALAELFALFGRRGLPVDRPEFADAVLAAHGLPPLPDQPAPRVPAGPVPAPGQAYADAPGIEDERRHLDAQRRIATAPPRLRREFLLRRAAMCDRVALRGGDADPEQVAGAVLTAHQLAEHDRVTADDDPRGYVRQQYRAWCGVTA
ncbi:hypothetical protein [Kitasatospora sp. NPDC087314]|uniref:hypothetical protein n=1 Tax=Kitasatospora sp. NPDC087314 TaxID=3364068 RepID=UPI00381C8101